MPRSEVDRLDTALPERMQRSGISSTRTAWHSAVVLAVETRPQTNDSATPQDNDQLPPQATGLVHEAYIRLVDVVKATA